MPAENAVATEWMISPGSLVYVGKSMYPTFEAPEIIYYVKYGDRKVRPGDVVVFDSPRENKSVTHRVISVDADGIKTQGDNNKNVDPWILQKEELDGRVIAARRGREYRRIEGGWRGRLAFSSIRASRRVRGALFWLLHAPRILAARSLGRKPLSSGPGGKSRELVNRYIWRFWGKP